MARLVQRLHDPRAPRWILLFGLVIALPALFGGFVLDDMLLQTHLEGRWVAPEAGPVSSLFRFIPGDPAERKLLEDVGVLPWWSHPDLHITFWRPLTALTHVLDAALWPRLALPQHAHNLLWWGLALAAGYGLLRELHGRGAVASLALLLFAVEDAHAWPIGWIANRNALLTLTFGALAALGHARWRRGGGWPALGGSLVALAAALLSGESGAGALAWIVAYQLTLDQSRGIRRLLPLVPAGIVVVAWRLVYQALGHGQHGSGLYIDPVGEPLTWARALVLRYPVLVLGQWLNAPADAFAMAPEAARIAAAALGYAVTIGIAWWLRPLLRDRPEARFHALSFALALVPPCATFPMSRLLTFAGLSAAGLLALQADRVGLLGPSPPDRRPLGTSLMLALHGPFAAIALLAQLWAVPYAFRAMQDGFAAQVDLPGPPPEVVVFLNGEVFFSAYLKIGLLPPDRQPERVAVLAPNASPVAVTRLDDHTLELRCEDGLFWPPKDQLLRSLDLPFEPGQRARRPDFEAEVLEVLPDGLPSAVRFRFERSLDDPAIRVMAWLGSAFEETSVGVGETVELPGLAP